MERKLDLDLESLLKSESDHALKERDHYQSASRLSTAASDEDHAELDRLLSETPDPRTERAISIDSLLEAIKSGSISANGLATLATIAPRGDEATIKSVTGLLGHSAWELRVAAVKCLGKLAIPGDIDVMSAITMLLKDKDPIVSYTAWETTGEMEANRVGWGDRGSPRSPRKQMERCD